MDKIWYVYINGKVEGPISTLDLEKNEFITPNTYVWKEGFETWKKVKNVPELKGFFADDSEEEALDQPTIDSEADEDLKGEDLALAIKNDPPYFFWLLLVILILIYFVVKLF